jgi:phage tail tube protein FII
LHASFENELAACTLKQTELAKQNETTAQQCEDAAAKAVRQADEINVLQQEKTELETKQKTLEGNKTVADELAFACVSKIEEANSAKTAAEKAHATAKTEYDAAIVQKAAQLHSDCDKTTAALKREQEAAIAQLRVAAEEHKAQIAKDIDVCKKGLTELEAANKALRGEKTAAEAARVKAERILAETRPGSLTAEITRKSHEIVALRNCKVLNDCEVARKLLDIVGMKFQTKTIPYETTKKGTVEVFKTSVVAYSPTAASYECGDEKTNPMVKGPVGKFVSDLLRLCRIVGETRTTHLTVKVESFETLTKQIVECLEAAVTAKNKPDCPNCPGSAELLQLLAQGDCPGKDAVVSGPVKEFLNQLFRSFSTDKNAQLPKPFLASEFSKVTETVMQKVADYKKARVTDVNKVTTDLKHQQELLQKNLKEQTVSKLSVATSVELGRQLSTERRQVAGLEAKIMAMKTDKTVKEENRTQRLSKRLSKIKALKHKNKKFEEKIQELKNTIATLNDTSNTSAEELTKQARSAKEDSFASQQKIQRYSENYGQLEIQLRNIFELLKKQAFGTAKAAESNKTKLQAYKTLIRTYDNNLNDMERERDAVVKQWNGSVWLDSRRYAIQTKRGDELRMDSVSPHDSPTKMTRSNELTVATVENIFEPIEIIKSKIRDDLKETIGDRQQRIQALVYSDEQSESDDEFESNDGSDDESFEDLGGGFVGGSRGADMLMNVLK